MPYSEGGALRVREFRGASDSSVLWTDIRTLRSWESFGIHCKEKFVPAKGFGRIWQGGQTAQCEHFAGLELDLAASCDKYEYRKLLSSLRDFQGWSRIWTDETGTIHMDKRLSSPYTCTEGYPPLRKGAVGVYVLVLQDALAALGFSQCGLSGYFDDAVQTALMQYQKSRGIHADGRACRMTWNMLCTEAAAAGHTNTVLRP